MWRADVEGVMPGGYSVVVIVVVAVRAGRASTPHPTYSRSLKDSQEALTREWYLIPRKNPSHSKQTFRVIFYYESKSSF